MNFLQKQNYVRELIESGADSATVYNYYWALFSFNLSLLADDHIVVWTNNTNNPIGTVTVVSYGGQSGVYTNSITVPYSINTVTITNFPIGKTIFVAARAYDGVSDYSEYSNEVSRKTKPNSPKNLTVGP